MQTDYSKYTIKELLEDDFFIGSILHPTIETENFWDTLIKQGLIDSKEFEQAKKFILLMRRPQKSMTLREKSDLWTSIEIRNKKNLLRKIRIRNMYLIGSVASLIAGIFILSQLLFEENRPLFKDVNQIAQTKLSAVDSKAKDIQLIRTDNNLIELKDKTVDVVLDDKGDIHVNSVPVNKSDSTAKENTKERKYNQLIVPYGRHSRLTLPDGTQMHINSGTSVAFPDSFSKNGREIYVNGEVYLEVAHNKEVPFYVYTNNMDVCVLGTAFNIRAYEDDTKQSVVLVSGSVNVRTKNNKEALLAPSQMLAYSSEKCIVSPVNTESYISWKDGYFLYQHEPLKDIVKQLSRYYRKDIVCSDSLVAITCSGKLDLNEDFSKVIAGLSDILSLQIIRTDDTYYLYKSLTP